MLTLSYRMPLQSVWRWNRGPNLTRKPDSGVEAGLEYLLQHVRDGGLVSGWNVMFEWYIWNFVCVPKYGWPELKIEQCRDTMAMAAAMNLPQQLGKCALVLGLPADKQKDARGKHLIQRLCKPHKPTKDRPGVWVEDPQLFAELCDYCDQDVVVEEAIAKKLRPLSPFEQDVWVATQRINLRGVPVSIDECTRIRDIVEDEKALLNAELAKLTGGKVKKASNRNGLLAWANERCAEPIYIEDPVEDEEDRPGHEEPVLENMRAKTVEYVLRNTLLPDDVRRALEIRAAVVQTSTAKYAKMLKVAADDGTLKNLFVYHGAGPGRWASKGGVNAQNFARPILSPEEIEIAFAALGGGHAAWRLLYGDQTMDAAVSCLRGVIKAPPGYDYVNADYSSVENRVAAWVSGQLDKLQMFAAGLDEYKTFASNSLYKIPYDQVTKDQRQTTKPVILGGIFGLGAYGLQAYAEQYGVSMGILEAKLAIKAFRNEYRHVRNTWYECNDAMLAAIENPGTWFEAGPKFQFISHRNFLWMKLPSGRVIAWAKPEIKVEKMTYEKDTIENGEIVEIETVTKYVDAVYVESIDTKTRQFMRHKLIGSSAFQSGVQGTARDILAQGVFNVERAGYPVCFMAHDELMSAVPKGTGDPEEFGRLMCEPAEWFNDLPLSYEAWRNERFRK